MFQTKKNTQSSHALACFTEWIHLIVAFCLCSLSAQTQSGIPILTRRSTTSAPCFIRRVSSTASRVIRIHLQPMTVSTRPLSSASTRRSSGRRLIRGSSGHGFKASETSPLAVAPSVLRRSACRSKRPMTPEPMGGRYGMRVMNIEIVDLSKHAVSNDHPLKTSQ